MGRGVKGAIGSFSSLVLLVFMHIATLGGAVLIVQRVLLCFVNRLKDFVQLGILGIYKPSEQMN